VTTTTAPSRMQELLEALGSTQVTKDDASESAGTAFVSALIERRTIGWDPHDVWLHRIKEPRDRDQDR
jgi:hypothetical protein